MLPLGSIFLLPVKQFIPFNGPPLPDLPGMPCTGYVVRPLGQKEDYQVHIYMRNDTKYNRKRKGYTRVTKPQNRRKSGKQCYPP